MSDNGKESRKIPDLQGRELVPGPVMPSGAVPDVIAVEQEQTVDTVFVVRLRGFGYPSKVVQDQMKALGRALHLHCGDHEMAVLIDGVVSPFIWDDKAYDWEHDGHEWAEQIKFGGNND